MKKILVTGGDGMLACDFIEIFSSSYNILALNSKKLDIKNLKNIREKIKEIKPDIILNFAAYTAVDDAEDTGIKLNYDVNALGVYNLAKASFNEGIDFITISSDYVFSGDNSNGYNEKDIITNPVNQYGMAKYLSEKLSIQENKNTIIIRTSWLYGGGKEYKNFVNTMIYLGRKLDSLKVINDQFGNPTNAKDISNAIGSIIENVESYRGKVLHFSNQTEGKGISWYDFAKEIFKQTGINIELQACDSSEFTTKAKRPAYSKLLNNSDIQLRDWRDGLRDYLDNLN